MDHIFYLTLFSGFSFLFFGMACFATQQMRREFERYGLAKYRSTVGALQLLGALGLFFGFFRLPELQVAAAAGLALLMLLGFFVRLKIRDGVLQFAPSLFYAILNGYLVHLLLQAH
ncbi:DoxX family protein [Maribacter sp. 2307ULW6-5]|uniref:DoxX family protein n=1 Tax=Maribacter sp. 2307ULW6-5 TaxID=3386275 RepID=UPI0039BC3F84